VNEVVFEIKTNIVTDKMLQEELSGLRPRIALPDEVLKDPVAFLPLTARGEAFRISFDRITIGGETTFKLR
jgi:hypothetical protein